MIVVEFKIKVDYFSLLKEDAKLRYLQILKIIGLQEYPYHLPAGIWLDDPNGKPLNIRYL